MIFDLQCTRAMSFIGGVAAVAICLGGTAAHAEVLDPAADPATELATDLIAEPVAPVAPAVPAEPGVEPAETSAEENGGDPAPSEDDDLREILGAVSDGFGASAYDGALESLADTSFAADDESGRTITVDDSGMVSFSAEGNAGFAVTFDDASSGLVNDSDGGPLAYEAGEDAVIVPQIIDTYFRGIFVLESAEAPNEFSMSLSSDDALSLSPDETGGIIFTDATGEEIGGFAAPWAKDARDRPVPTQYLIDGQTVRQVVDVSSLGADDFPVVADPAAYVNFTKKYVVDVRNHGNVAKWRYLNQCTAKKGTTCNIGRTYTVSASVQTALNASFKFVGASIGVTAGASRSVNVSCSVKGPKKVTLHASATKKTYKIRSVRSYGVPPWIKRDVRTSHTLTAYKPNGKYVCS